MDTIPRAGGTADWETRMRGKGSDWLLQEGEKPYQLELKNHPGKKTICPLFEGVLYHRDCDMK